MLAISLYSSAKSIEGAFACGYETATETRKPQEEAIASAEQTISDALIDKR
jgi:hypothetical protein